MPDAGRRGGSSGECCAIDVLVVAPALNSRLRHWVSDVDDALARAQERLDLAITALRQRGVLARGEIGDADPLLAIADALSSFPADEIVIATLPAGRSNWIECGLVAKATTLPHPDRAPRVELRPGRGRSPNPTRSSG